MRSSTGTYVPNVDHLRAFAVIAVFIWHFTHHSSACSALCFGRAYSDVGFLLSFLEEGHTGVSLFMVISGYIFARLCDGRRINPGRFWLNRGLRLLPLLIFWSIITALARWQVVLENLRGYELWSAAKNVVDTAMAPGGWSIVVEIEYYILFPLVLLLRRSGIKWLAAAVILLVASRTAYFLHSGSVQYLSYWTLAGRADQLLIGYIAYVAATEIAFFRESGPWMALIGLVGLALSAEAFNVRGGFIGFDGYPSRSPWWIVIPTIEAILYAMIVVGYQAIRIPRRLSTVLAKIGEWSYSIYLSHFHLIPLLYFFWDQIFGIPDGFVGRTVIAMLLVFPFVVLISAITYRTVELPFLKNRVDYFEK
jgi:peptidoglycan/LPS O-acetylase OafA/YrhL